MALTKGTNSYVTLDEADAYFEDRIGNSQWDSATDSVKEMALVTAWYQIEQLHFFGITISGTQPMIWPRRIPSSDGIVNNRTGRPIVLSSTLTDSAGNPVQNQDGGVDHYAPTEIEVAQYELAFHYVKNPDLIQDASSVTNLTLGTISLEAITTVSMMPRYVRRIMSQYLENGETNNWFLAN